MANQRQDRRRYAALLGFRPDDLQTKPAFLLVDRDGYQFVDMMSAATLFERDDSGERGWAAPSAWAGFFAGEPELSGWKFRPVPTTRIPFREENV
jgi:hypothetical protein